MRTCRLTVSLLLMAVVVLLASAAHAQSVPTEGYLIWTKSATGQAAVWRVNPNDGSFLGGSLIGPAAGVGGGWEVTRFVPSAVRLATFSLPGVPPDSRRSGW